MILYRCYKCYILLSLPFLEYCRSFYDLERVREACGGGRLHQADLGSRHVFREREGGAVSCRHTGLIMFCCCFFSIFIFLFSLYFHIVDVVVVVVVVFQLFSTTGALVVITV